MVAIGGSGPEGIARTPRLTYNQPLKIPDSGRRARGSGKEEFDGSQGVDEKDQKRTEPDGAAVVLERFFEDEKG
ncbi:hypothetical protein JW905_19220 [bacterium]|nr:hypothetical protein [candidate division CSSED10-310 bacterium]